MNWWNKDISQIGQYYCGNMFIIVCLCIKICDWACKTQTHLHKLHVQMFRQWYFSWSLFIINTLCNLYLLSYGYINATWKFQLHTYLEHFNIKTMVCWSSKNNTNFVYRYFCRPSHILWYVWLCYKLLH